MLVGAIPSLHVADPVMFAGPLPAEFWTSPLKKCHACPDAVKSFCPQPIDTQDIAL